MSLNLHLDEYSNDEQFESSVESFSKVHSNSRFIEPDLSSDIVYKEEFIPEKFPNSRALPDWMTIQPSPTKKRKRQDVEAKTRPKKQKTDVR